MGEAEHDALDVDFLADHITRFSLAALGRGPNIVGPSAAPSAGTRKTVPR
jgi:hypothetical protein